MASWRNIEIDGRRYKWQLSSDDRSGVGPPAIRVVARAESGGSTMVTWFAGGNLVTPWLVRYAIEHAIANGWTPAQPGAQQTFRIDGVLPDRRVAVPEPPPIVVTETELLDRIAESPDGDDQARLVYADWLLERADIRGERIMLACADAARGLTQVESERALELDTTRDAWLGPVIDVTQYRLWWRGLLDHVQLGKRVPGSVDLALGHPAWSSVRTVDTVGAFLAVDDIARLVTQPALHSVRRLTVDARVVLAIASREFRHLAELAIVPGTPVTPSEITAIDAAMPALRELVVSPRTTDELVAVLDSRATRLVLHDSFAQLAAWRPVLDVEAAAHLEVIRLILSGRGYGHHLGPTVELRRGRDGRWSALELGWQSQDWPLARTSLITALAALPEDALTSVAVQATPPLDDAAFVREIWVALSRQRGIDFSR